MPDLVAPKTAVKALEPAASLPRSDSVSTVQRSALSDECLSPAVDIAHIQKTLSSTTKRQSLKSSANVIYLDASPGMTPPSLSREEDTAKEPKGFLQTCRDKMAAGLSSCKNFCAVKYEAAKEKLGEVYQDVKKEIASALASLSAHIPEPIKALADRACSFARDCITFAAPILGKTLSGFLAKAVDSVRVAITGNSENTTTADSAPETKVIRLALDPQLTSQRGEQAATSMAETFSTQGSGTTTFHFDAKIDSYAMLTGILVKYALEVAEKKREEKKKEETLAAQTEQHKKELEKEKQRLLSAHPEIAPLVQFIQTEFGVDHIPSYEQVQKLMRQREKGAQEAK
jgi:hypothetical protein